MVDVDDEVRLAIPAEPGFLRLARLTAAAVASRMGFTFDEVEDLRIAVDELCYFLIGGRPASGSLELTCAIRPGGLEVAGRGSWASAEGTGGGVATELPELSRRILESVVDTYECDGDPAAPHFRLLKRHASD